MIEKLIKVLNTFNASDASDAKTVIINNGYKQLKNYCKYAKSNKNKTHFYFYLAIVYHWIEQNYDEAKKYYLMAIDKNNVDAMVDFGYYFEKIEKNYTEAKKYYMMAIEKNKNIYAMWNLGMYFYRVEKNYNEAIKYYAMASENGLDMTDEIIFVNRKILRMKRINIFSYLKNTSAIKNKIHVEHNECCVCKLEYTLTIGFNCAKKYDTHNYCQRCALTWYKNKQLTCLLCFAAIEPENLLLCVK